MIEYLNQNFPGWFTKSKITEKKLSKLSIPKTIFKRFDNNLLLQDEKGHVMAVINPSNNRVYV